MKFSWDGIQWGRSVYQYLDKPYLFVDKSTHNFDRVKLFYYFTWWNWLPPTYRYFGRRSMYYDGPHVSFGFWYFNWSWTTQWTNWELH